MRRTKGMGTISQRKSDGIWIARVDLGGTPRLRKTFSSMDREVAEKRLQDWLDTNRPELATRDPLEPKGRSHHMRLARELGTHTWQEWEAKQAEQGHLCFYCKRSVGAGGMKDHYVPVSRGGSDGIDNIVLACWDCNHAKSDLMPEEFIEWAESSGFYTRPQRTTRINSNGYTLRLSPEMIELMKVPKGQRMKWLERRRWRREQELAAAIAEATQDDE